MEGKPEDIAKHDPHSGPVGSRFESRRVRWVRILHAVEIAYWENQDVILSDCGVENQIVGSAGERCPADIVRRTPARGRAAQGRGW